ncbi:MAG: hypothetical protein K2X99_08900 [Gemmatimonadaceae bacterium]|nr:hypothetical protein [Gemmatimonadaceae bacterium]
MNAALLLLVVGTVAAPPRDAEDWRWREAVPATTTLEINGVLGDITVERSRDAFVEVVAERVGHAPAASRVSLEVVRSASRVTICALYPTPDYRTKKWRGDPGPNFCAPADSGRNNVFDDDVKVHFIVRVPPNVHLVLKTMNGTICGAGLANTIIASNVMGNIDLTTSAWAEAASIAGDVALTMGRTDWKGDRDVRSTSGRVSVVLPDAAATSVDAETLSHARISSDTSITARRTAGDAMGRRRARWAYGVAGRALFVRSMSGAVSVRRQSRTIRSEERE